MAANNRDGTDCEPVFVTARTLPSRHVLPETIDLCVAAENTSGRGTIRGAQRIRGLWRIYPRTTEARNILLVQGMTLWDVQITLLDKNPFILRDENGQEKPATKLWVSNVPISVDDSVIETALVKKGCELRAKIRKELARNKEGKLTNWETGRRFVYITVPTVPLPKSFQVGIFSAEIYYKEMKDKERKKCTNCLLPDHTAATCTNPVVCRSCHRPGHRQMECAESLTNDRPTVYTTQSQESEETSGVEMAAARDPSPSPLSQSDIIPPTQEVYDTGRDAASQSGNTTPRAQGGKKKKKKNGKEKGKIQSVLDAVFSSRDAAPKRPHGNISDEGEEENKTKRAAQEARPACSEDQEMGENSGAG